MSDENLIIPSPGHGHRNVTSPADEKVDKRAALGRLIPEGGASYHDVMNDAMTQSRSTCTSFPAHSNLAAHHINLHILL